MNITKYQEAKRKALVAHMKTMLLSELCWFELGIDPTGLSDAFMLGIIRDSIREKENG